MNSIIKASTQTLACIAKDYLAIQPSALASEGTFSITGLTNIDRRNCLLRSTFDALQVLKSGCRNGVISAIDDATKAGKLWEEELEVPF